MRCSVTRPVSPTEIGPGVTLHLGHPGGDCRVFVVTSDKGMDPVSAREGWQAMEMGDEPVVEGAQAPFTGVTLMIRADYLKQWHFPA